MYPPRKQRAINVGKQLYILPNVRPQALRGWLWPGILQSPCVAHPAYTYTPAWHSTVGQPRCYIALEADATHPPVLLLLVTDYRLILLE